MSMDTFVSPLTIHEPTVGTEIDFGPVMLTTATRSLQSALETEIRRPIADLPFDLREEASGLLDAYPGPGRPFIGLFYVPIWSFLAHTTQAPARRRETALMTAAKTAHAMSLFLHLWDDHLTDKQLDTDMLRLHMRSLAWQRFQSAVDKLARHLPDGRDRLGHLLALYMTSTHRPPAAPDLDSFCARFVSQIGIWRVAPTVLGFASDGERGAQQLDRIICDFAVAWRIIDDLQDLSTDLRSCQETAVLHLLDAGERKIWKAHRATLGSPAEDKSWSRFWRMIRDGGVVTRTTNRIDILMERACQGALQAGWTSLADDLAAAARLARPLRADT